MNEAISKQWPLMTTKGSAIQVSAGPMFDGAVAIWITGQRGGLIRMEYLTAQQARAMASRLLAEADVLEQRAMPQ